MLKSIAIAFALALIFLSAPASAYTEEQRRACEADAFRLCDHAIPDEGRVKACMLAKIRQLSPGCRRVFTRGRR
jgi:hypothetical protein